MTESILKGELLVICSNLSQWKDDNVIGLLLYQGGLSPTGSGEASL